MTMRKRLHQWPVKILLASLVLGGGLLAPRMVTAGSIYSAGHGDLGVEYDGGGTFDLHIHLGTSAVVDGVPLSSDAEFEPDELAIFVPGPAVPRPDGGAWDFLGNTSGEPIWFLPSTDDPTKPFLGWATEELDPADWDGDFTWSLVDFSGPGDFSVWDLDGAFNPIVLMSTWDGIDGADSFTMPFGEHLHLNLGFTATGTYQITLQGQGLHLSDGLVTGSAVFTFHVGATPQVVPEPASLLSLGAGLGLIALAGAYRRRTL